ncbi:hypothetical protein [Mycobacterium interjectum]|uniref:hypothetical protein n=1 Tax=Mycobacterium interjectum TaxID=33895 RepID=UPI0008335915|nr:hypothetical protein [Mycobacterium interjectum]MCV7090075.1 hypothetical protein [Mycobacterium interjectum]
MTLTQEHSLLPTYFTPPLTNPAPGGLVNAVSWTEETGPPRWVEAGIALRSSVSGNFSGELSAGVWGAGWCDEPGSGSVSGEVKEGVRPDDPGTFFGITCWGFDACDLTPESRAEVLTRCQQVLRIREPNLVAREFAGRLLVDAGAPIAGGDLIEAVGEIECLFADANVVGAVHCSPFLLPHLVSHVLITRGGVGGWLTPGGHAVIFDGGYRPVLGDSLLIATSRPLWGWRETVAVRDVIDYQENTYIGIAERSCVIAYEQPLGAVSIEGGSA